MTLDSSECTTAIIEDLEQFCLAHSMPQSEAAITNAIRRAKSESCSEMLDAAMALNAANAISQLDALAHIPAEWVAQAIAYLCGPEGGEFAGQDFSLKTEEGRKRVGLPEL